MKQTAKFGTANPPTSINSYNNFNHNTSSFIKHLQTEQTQNFNKSGYHNQHEQYENYENYNDSVMKIDELQPHETELHSETVLVNKNFNNTNNNNNNDINTKSNKFQQQRQRTRIFSTETNNRMPSQALNSNNLTYNCSICERLRVICPTKNYLTQTNCEKCLLNKKNSNINMNQNKNDEQNIKTHYYSNNKNQNNTVNINNMDFDETKGHNYTHNKKPINLSSNLNNLNHTLGYVNPPHLSQFQYHQVNKVILNNKIFPLKSTRSNSAYPIIHNKFKKQQTIINNPNNNNNNKPKLHLQQNPTTKFIPNINKQPIYKQTQQIIYYPVIHNHLVYVNNNNNQNSHNINPESSYQSIKKYSSYNNNKSYNASKFNKSTKKHFFNDLMKSMNIRENDLPTPVQMKKLAESIRREKSHVNEQNDDE